eukprot:2402363-Pyramimonas_sp.AAC.1
MSLSKSTMCIVGPRVPPKVRLTMHLVRFTCAENAPSVHWRVTAAVSLGPPGGAAACAADSAAGLQCTNWLAPGRERSRSQQ